MTIECYLDKCHHHSVHTQPGEGPFCYHMECQRTQKEIDTMLTEKLERQELAQFRHWAVSKGHYNLVAGVDRYLKFLDDRHNMGNYQPAPQVIPDDH